jgi:hypothetical protein
MSVFFVPVSNIQSIAIREEILLKEMREIQFMLSTLPSQEALTLPVIGINQ